MFFKTQLTIAFTALCFFAAESEAQQVVTQCGASSGMRYQLEPNEEGWQKDGIRDGNITFVRDRNGDYDIAMTDASGIWTAKADGATVVATRAEGGRLNLVVVYPLSTIEVYQLTLSNDGSGTLIWSNMKNGVLGSTHAFLFVSKCRR